MAYVVAEILPPICLLLVALGYASALALRKAEHRKLAFLDSLLERTGEMPDPFYRVR
jgi:hypothetical protein